MGRVVLLLLIIVTVIVLWKAFGPKTWNNGAGPGNGADKGQFPQLGRQKREAVERKGPDDDPDFLWNLKKERFKAQREEERRIEEARQRFDREAKQQKKPGQNNPAEQDAPSTPAAKDEGNPPTSENRADERGDGRTDGHGDGRNDGRSDGKAEGGAS
ncbi:MAG TPA: hypothetical protein H9870_04485 [Candidatus Corynebacterium avicola]|uniref:Uncharacterized protein n=1 Tax=Candidatus Corynebacterium avicola TaxID=2838527 RepID=A0A9D1RNN4_9CORY|nr:hypothetical protein [Candidatus Corynebacterium avicola]